VEKDGKLPKDQGGSKERPIGIMTSKNKKVKTDKTRVEAAAKSVGKPSAVQKMGRRRGTLGNDISTSKPLPATEAIARKKFAPKPETREHERVTVGNL